MQYDNLAVCTIVANREGEVSSCDVPFSNNLQQFNADYLRLTKQVAESCQNHDLTNSMVIGTSTLAQYEIDGAVGMYSGVFNNPFLIWGKYKRHWWKRTLTKGNSEPSCIKPYISSVMNVLLLIPFLFVFPH